jgi:GH15 family glucan-1,4-alpha-glucosidase
MDSFEVTRRYLGRTLVLETTFTTDAGEARLVDALITGPREDGRRLGARPLPLLVRLVECTRGEVPLRHEFHPRPEYGLIHPLLREEPAGLLGRGGASVLLLSVADDLEMTIDESSASGESTLREGERLAFSLEHSSSSDEPPSPRGQDEILDLLDETREAWQAWSETDGRYRGPHEDLVDVSGRVLKALTYEPTGAMVAAPTTSLPTQVGGTRNWDYRYTWLRDSSFTLRAFDVVGCDPEATALFDFLARTALSQVRRQGDVQAVYGIGGEHDLTERRLEHLAGWRGSEPVRVGNHAWQQRQLDVYGELIGAAFQARQELPEADELVRAFLVRLADAAADQWERKDHGIWEMRLPPADYVHSKLMCWVALDRAIRLADVLDADHRVDDWERERKRVRKAILNHGWSDRLGAFRQSFDRDVLDASTLMIPIVGFLQPGDRRVISTLEAVEDGLTDERGLVYRYLASDGLDGGEGTFLLCTFWLAEAWARAGRVQRASELFRLAVERTNDVGLLTEQVDDDGYLIGNFPQAFSHIGLVNAAHALANAEGTAPTP